MARYDMTCEKCGHKEEHDRPATEGPPKTCPQCKSKRYRMIWHTFALITNYSPMHPRARRGTQRNR